jgi:hypothetical protein
MEVTRPSSRELLGLLLLGSTVLALSAFLLIAALVLGT